MSLDAKIPSGPLAQKWDQHKFDVKLVNPANKRKFDIIVVGSGLAGASAAASLAELGYKVKCFCFQDSPRRAHSIAAQGGINAAKNYQNDGDSVYRLFYDTIKGGTSARARPMSIVWHKSARTSLTNAWRKACPLPGNTAVCWRTVPSVERRFPGPFTRGAKPVNNFCWVLTRRCAGRLAWEQ